jgi:hypothetical protein
MNLQRVDVIDTSAVTARNRPQHKRAPHFRVTGCLAATLARRHGRIVEPKTPSPRTTTASEDAVHAIETTIDLFGSYLDPTPSTSTAPSSEYTWASDVLASSGIVSLTFHDLGAFVYVPCPYPALPFGQLKFPTVALPLGQFQDLVSMEKAVLSASGVPFSTLNAYAEALSMPFGQSLQHMFPSLSFALPLPADGISTITSYVSGISSEQWQWMISAVEPASPPKPWYEETLRALDKIEGFGALGVGWAGDDSVPADDPTREAATDLVINLCEHWQPPQVTLSADGEIGMAWYRAGNRVEVLVQPDGYIVSLGKFDGAFIDGDDVAWSSETPPKLLQLLGRLFS